MSTDTERTVSHYAMLRQLMIRDPLAREIGRLFIQCHTASPSSQDHAELQALLQQQCETLRQKYGVRSIRLPDAAWLDQVKDDTRWELSEEYPEQIKAWPRVKREQLVDAFVHSWAHEWWSAQSDCSMFTAETNWIPPAGQMQFVQKPDGTFRGQWVDGHPPPVGEPPTLTITINLTLTHVMGITYLMTAIKQLVHQKLQELPRNWRSYPQALSFLRTLDWETFHKDLRRYDWHMQQGLSFRRIAELERQEEAGQVIPEPPTPAKVGIAVPGEDTVERAVKRIYHAIYRTPYKVGRRFKRADLHGADGVVEC